MRMSGKAQDSGSDFRFRDFLIILLCLLGTGVSLNLFRLDLFRTINSQNEPPVGTITIKNNIVQRRMENRVLWDRLFAESPVYLGDLIRVADLSDATLHIDNTHLELYENTLIRIQRAPDGDGSYHIELNEGSINLAAGGDIVLLLNGSRIEASQGAVISAASGENGTAFSITEGTATIIQGDQRRELSAGTIVALDTEGIEKAEPALVVIHPRANARYLKEKPDPLSVEFAWNKTNIAEGEALFLEISEKPNFTHIFQVMECFDTKTEALLNTGLWHWRLSYKGVSLSTGRLIIEQSGKTEEPADRQEQPAPAVTPAPVETPAVPVSVPLSLLPAPGNRLPSTGSLIGIEELRARSIVFRWSRVPEANAYIFTLYQQTAAGRKEIIRRAPDNSTTWTLNDLGLLDRGTFVWQVEAVVRNRNGTIERRGRIGENSFVLDIPYPGPPEVRIEEEAFTNGR